MRLYRKWPLFFLIFFGGVYPIEGVSEVDQADEQAFISFFKESGERSLVLARELAALLDKNWTYVAQSQAFRLRSELGVEEVERVNHSVRAILTEVFDLSFNVANHPNAIRQTTIPAFLGSFALIGFVLFVANNVDFVIRDLGGVGFFPFLNSIATLPPFHQLLEVEVGFVVPSLVVGFLFASIFSILRGIGDVVIPKRFNTERAVLFFGAIPLVFWKFMIDHNIGYKQLLDKVARLPKKSGTHWGDLIKNLPDCSHLKID